jgi:two-component system, cell cycle sensor histidine kinase and response regulator CckA
MIMDITERHLAEQALRESEEKFRNLFENLYDAYYSTDPTGLIFMASPSVEKLLGYKSDEIIGLDMKSLYVNPQEREEFLRQIMRNGSVEDFEAQLRRKDNSVIWVSTNAKMLKDEKGNFFGVGGITRDVTERKRAKESLLLFRALTESEQKYRNLVDNASVGVFKSSLSGEVLYANDALIKMFEFGSLEEVIADGVWAKYKDPEDRKAFLENLKKKGKIENFETELLTATGRSRNVLISGAFEGDFISGMIMDITERHLAEQALRESEEKYRNLFENLYDVYYRTDPTGLISIASPSVETLLGYKSDEIVGLDMKSLYVNAQEREEFLSQIMRNGSVEDFQAQLRRKDNSVIWVSTNSKILKDEKGNFLGVEGLARDVTERKRAEEEKRKLEAQLNQAQKMESIGTLAGGVAHDFNNILTAIIGNAELALTDLGKNSRVNQSLDEILKAGHRAAALTRQLLAFSRKELIRPEILDLTSLMVNFEKMLRRLIGEDIDLVTVYTPDLWQVEADPGQMEQIIMNLAVNARDAMPKGGALTVETTNVELDKGYFRDHGVENEAGPYVVLAITDSGKGMDEEIQARIFEPFFTTKGLGTGTGLGLSTVYGIVKQNKGYIWVYSEPERGTTFKIYLPTAGADAEAGKTKLFPVRSLKGSETILVVDDDEMLRKTAEKMLKGYGYRVLRAKDGNEALNISGSHDGPIHLMLTDVVMPGMSGRDLSEQLKSTVPEIKVLYMSGYTNDAIAHHGILEKDVEFIQKPFTREGLATKVREVLERKQD